MLFEYEDSMWKHLLLFSSVFVQASGNMQCQCALGYRNGASESSSELCMGPAENGKHPCYPSPCNADWTACSQQSSQQSSQGFLPWRKESDHIGKRPVCNANIDVTNGKNYRYTTLEKCKQACVDTTGCDTISRYVYTGKTDTSEWHCWFYECGAQSTYQWEPQTSWGHGANQALTYFLYTPGKQSTKVIHETRYIDKVRWTNETRYIDKTRWTNETRYIDKVRWANETRYIDKVRWTNETRYIDKVRWTNETRYIDKIHWSNETRYIDKIRWTNETRYIDKIRWTNRTIDRIVNKTRYIDKIRWTNKTIGRIVNKTIYANTLGPAALPEESADEIFKSKESSDDCSQWDTRDYVLILIIAVVAVAWCIKETIEFFDCRMRKKKVEEEMFPDAELPPMAWEVKVDDIVKE